MSALIIKNMHDTAEPSETTLSDIINVEELWNIYRYYCRFMYLTDEKETSHSVSAFLAWLEVEGDDVMICKTCSDIHFSNEDTEEE